MFKKILNRMVKKNFTEKLSFKRRKRLVVAKLSVTYVSGANLFQALKILTGNP